MGACSQLEKRRKELSKGGRRIMKRGMSKGRRIKREEKSRRKAQNDGPSESERKRV